MSYAFNDFIRDVQMDYASQQSGVVLRDWDRWKAIRGPVTPYKERALTPRQRAAARRREKALAKARRELKAILKRFPELANELQDDYE